MRLSPSAREALVALGPGQTLPQVIQSTDDVSFTVDITSDAADALWVMRL